MRVAGARARPPRPPPPPLSPVIAAHALDRGREAEGGRAVAAKPTLTFFFAARCAPTCSPSCASSPATCANPIAACRRKTWPRSGRGPGSSSTARRRSPSSTTCTPSSPRTMSPRGTWRIWRCGAPRWRGTCTCRRREFFFFWGGGDKKKTQNEKSTPFPPPPPPHSYVNINLPRGSHVEEAIYPLQLPDGAPVPHADAAADLLGLAPKKAQKKADAMVKVWEEGGRVGREGLAAGGSASARSRARARLGPPRAAPAPRAAPRRAEWSVLTATGCPRRSTAPPPSPTKPLPLLPLSPGPRLPQRLHPVQAPRRRPGGRPARHRAADGGDRAAVGDREQRVWPVGRLFRQHRRPHRPHPGLCVWHGPVHVLEPRPRESRRWGGGSKEKTKTLSEP